MRSDTTDGAAEAAERGERMANPHRTGTRAWFEWEDTYSDMRVAMGREPDSNAGNPAWG